MLLLLSGCSSSDTDIASSEPEQPVTVAAGVPIGFSVAQVDKSGTRASGFIKDHDDASLTPANGDIDIQDVGFGVFASYTGMYKYSASTVKPNFMYNDHVFWGGADPKWTYTPLRFWPNGEGEAEGTEGSVPHYVSFFGYAPYSDGDPTDTGDYEENPLDPSDMSRLTTKGAADYCIPTFSLNHQTGDPWLVYRIIDQKNLDRQVDLLFADGTDDKLLDRSKSMYPIDPGDPTAHRVSLSFKHALGLFGEKVTLQLQQKADPDDNTEPDGAKEVLLKIKNTELKITKITIDYQLTSKARLTLWNHGEPNWEPILSQLMLEQRTATIFDSTDGSKDPITLFKCTEDVADTTLPTWDGSKYYWESATDDGNAGVFFIPLEVDGYPQTATLNITYEIYVKGIKDPSLSKTKSHEFMLNKYYDVFKEGGRRMNQINVTLTLDDD